MESARADGQGSWSIGAVAGSDAPGTLADHLWLAEAHLALAARGAADHVTAAARITRAALDTFGDAREIGCFLNDATANGLPVRQKDWWDNAVPAGNSILLHVLAGLEARDPDGDWGRRRAELATAYAGMVSHAPHGVGKALEALEVGEDGVPVIHIGPGASRADAERALRGIAREVHLASGGQAGFQLCQGRRCLAPAGTAGALASLLRD